MSTDDRDLLLTLAARVADAEDIDWSAYQDLDPSLTSRFDHLAAIARIAATFRDASPKPNLGSSVDQGTGVDCGPGVDRGTGDDPPRFRWGPLLVYEKIGEGRFGQVYRAVDPRLDREVALKLRPLDRGRGLDARRFLEEARRLARVSHPHVIAVYGADIDEGRAGLWTELVAGAVLEDRLAEGPFPPDEVVRLGRQLCGAVGAVHAAGLVHGDITARNVIVDRAGDLRLADFGSATDRRRPGSGSPGTPLVAAPELLAGGMPSPRSDLYAVAALLHRLLTGRHPIEAGSVAGLLERHRGGERPSLRGSDLPPDLVRVIERGLEPDPADRPSSAIELDEELALAGAVLHASAPRARGPMDLRSSSASLPAPRTSFVGRDTERVQIDEAFTVHRWVTLVGTGGVGKTRLAVESARERSAAYPDGVWFIPLAEVSPEDDVGQAVAEALGVSGDDVDEGLLRRVRPWRALLVLDNCEHLLDDVARVVSRLLDVAPRLHVLATSREPVDADGERLIEVVGLRTDGDPAHAPGVCLFLDRLAAVQGDADAAPPDLIDDLLRWTGGLPLAIELVASAGRSTSLHALRDELVAGERELRGRRGASPRHASIDAVVAWSHRRLAPAVQVVMETLAVFRGGATLEAVVAVHPPGSSPQAVRDALSVLDRASLVVSSAAGDRWTLLDPIRQFAERRLRDRGDLRASRDRHLAHILDRAEASPSRADRSAFAAYLAEQGMERENLRAAVGWAAADPGRYPAGHRLVAALRPVWSATDPDRRLRPDLERLVGTGPITSPAHARTACAWVAMAWPFGEHAGKVDLLRRAAEASVGFGDVATAASVHEILARRLTVAGHVDEAGTVLAYAAELAQKAGDPWIIAGILQARIGRCVLTSELELAHQLLAEAREIAATLSDPWLVRSLAVNAAHVAYAERDYEAAAGHEARALDLIRSASDPNPQLEAATLRSLAVYVSLSGDADRAMDLYRESLAISRRHGFRVLEAGALSSLGEEARRRGETARAVMLLRDALAVEVEAEEPVVRRSTALSLAWALTTEGEMAEAREAVAIGLDAGRRVGGIEEVFTWFFVAQIAVAAGAYSTAARLMGAVEAGCEREGAGEELAEFDDVRTIMAQLREALGDEMVERERVRGRALSVDAVIGLAGDVPPEGTLTEARTPDHGSPAWPPVPTPRARTRSHHRVRRR